MTDLKLSNVLSSTPTPTLPTTTATATAEKTNSSHFQCAICLLGYGDGIGGQAPFRLKACQHVFHYNCILSWFTQKQRCPMCCADEKGDSLPCVDLCLQHGLVPATHGFHACVSGCTAYLRRSCAGVCADSQKVETSPFRNAKLAQLHDNFHKQYAKLHSQSLSTLKQHTCSGICVYCKQSVYFLWNGKTAIEQCPNCKRSFS
jgi:hypothetical protein